MFAFFFCLFDKGLCGLEFQLPSALSSTPCIISVRCKLMAGSGVSTVIESLFKGLGETAADVLSTLLFCSSSICFLLASSFFFASSSSLHRQSRSFFFLICWRRCSPIFCILSRLASCFSFICCSRSERVVIIFHVSFMVIESLFKNTAAGGPMLGAGGGRVVVGCLPESLVCCLVKDFQSPPILRGLTFCVVVKKIIFLLKLDGGTDGVALREVLIALFDVNANAMAGFAQIRFFRLSADV